MKINIPFNEWSKERLLILRKTATSRTKKYGESGDIFIVNDIKYELEFVMKLPLHVIRDYLYKTEGCVSKMEFEKVWADIHPKKGWDDNQMVWYHHFTPVIE